MAQDVLTQERLRKLDDIKEKGINPYPYNYEKKSSSKDIKEKFDEKLKPEEKSGETTSYAGRILGLRRMGKVTFMHIQDEDDKLQVYFQQDVLEKENYKLLKKLDLGDIIGVEGEIFKTRTGEVTIEVSSYTLLTKTIKTLPEKYHGVKDKEIRYRQRYTDLIMSQDVKEVFKKRSKMIKSLRDFLHERGFTEVETPLLQTQYGGASARPFETHINAWNMKMFLSISPELYLKRIAVGGFEKIFTICKSFRNEGVDATHNPEFTMIEIYQAYADYNDMMKLIEEAYEYCSLQINGTTKVKHMYKGEEVEINFKAPWPKKTMAEAIQEVLKIDVHKMSKEDLLDFANKNNLDAGSSMSWGDLVLHIFELVEPSIIQPTHICDMPKEGTPLCKRHRENKLLNEQCEPIGMGMELGNMYSELNDPILQEEELVKQSEKGRGGDEEAHPMDTDFINAIKVGLPPTGGIGWGIDRMAILMTGQDSIRDVIFFPTMKPENASAESSKKKKVNNMAIAIVNKGANMEKWQEMSTIAHLNAAFGARAGLGLFNKDSLKTKDDSEIKFNISDAIMIKEASSSDQLKEIKKLAEEKGFQVSEFIREMIDTSNDVKIAEDIEEKSLDEVEYLGILIYGKRSSVDNMTKELKLFS